jgi:hypothetical protein
VEILRDLLISAKLLTKTSSELEQMLGNLDLVTPVQGKHAEGERDIDEGSSFLFQSDLIVQAINASFIKLFLLFSFLSYFFLLIFAHLFINDRS